MNESVDLFEEVQQVGKKPVRNFFKVTTGLFIVALAFNLTRQKGDINEVTTALFAGFLISALAGIFLNIKMVTQVRNDGVYVRFPPFQPSFDHYAWNDIQEVYLRTFDAITEYSGWGVRLGGWGVKFGASGKGFILRGTTGLQLVLKNRSKILISTERADEISEVLIKLKI